MGFLPQWFSQASRFFFLLIKHFAANFALLFGLQVGRIRGEWRRWTGCRAQGHVSRWGSFSGSEILHAQGNSLPWIIASSKMTQNSLTLVYLLYRVTVHWGCGVAEGCKHNLEAFRKKLSVHVKLFPPPSTRIWFYSLELVPVSNTHRRSLSLSQPGCPSTYGCFWIKGLKSPPYFRFGGCIFCLIWSSPLPSCFQTFFTVSHR